jgi:hypothetical protein
MIKLIPKTSTLKHQNVTSQQQEINNNNNNNNYISTNRNQNNLTATTTVTATKHPFELTICVQVNLPFNQKTIVRVKPDIKLNDLFDLICAEAKLERIKYNFLILNKNNLNMDETFDSFNTKEVCLVLKNNNNNNNNNETASSKTLSKFDCLLLLFVSFYFFFYCLRNKIMLLTIVNNNRRKNFIFFMI